VTTNPAVYIKTGRGRGRPKKTEEIAKTNSRPDGKKSSLKKDGLEKKNFDKLEKSPEGEK
jgi:hypothetical protein